MLRNIFVVLGMVFCFCVSCDKEDNDVKAVENIRDWYKVEDKPGEVNHLLYKMYKYYDVTIFINDTLGQEERGVDAYGEPIVHTELFDMGYYVYGTYTDGRMTLSADSAAMIVAINMIEDRVIPHLPEPGAYRPHSFLLADSVFLTQQIGFSYVTYETDIYSRGIRGMVIGKLNAIKNMSEDELKWFGGEILAVKCADWIQEFCVDELLDFYKISGDSNYDEASMFAPADCPEELGFIKWLEVEVSSRNWVKTPTKEQDIRDYVAATYVYRGEKEKFYELYRDYKDIIKKFDLMVPLVERFEEVNCEVK